MDYSSDAESDFYGDEEMVKHLEAEVKKLDVGRWWRRDGLIQSPIKMQAAKRAEPVVRQALHNPYAGVSYAWQVGESVEHFLQRLPPATTNVTAQRSWIYICNPYVDRRCRRDADSQKVRGCADEAPEEEGSDVLRFIEGGMARLHLASAFLERCRKSSGARAAITREVMKAVGDASADILALAHNLRVRSGKWMLFCPVESVDAIWSIVAQATAKNELGIAAKVSPRGGCDMKCERLICVYTADFRDAADVQRVAIRLKQLGLLKGQEKSLYYKPDAYTYLGISGNNPWAIKASIYSSRDVLGKK